MSEWMPEIRDGVCVNGCLPLTREKREELQSMKSQAVSFGLLWNARGAMPVIRWDSEFEDWIEARQEFLRIARRRGQDVSFWNSYRQVPVADKRNQILVWNQKSVPSCCLTATSHAIQAATLIAATMGAPIKYDAVNPIYAHYRSTGGVMNSGQDCFTAGRFINQNGVFPVSVVGDNNVSTPTDVGKYEGKALEHRVAIAFCEDPNPDTVFRLAEAGLPFVFGSAQFYISAVTDRNGIAVGDRLTSGAHAEMGGAAYLEMGGEQYAYVQNSHGDMYTPDKTGHTTSGYWLTRPGWELLCSTMTRYGDPFVVLPRADLSDKMTFVPNHFKESL